MTATTSAAPVRGAAPVAATPSVRRAPARQVRPGAARRTGLRAAVDLGVLVCAVAVALVPLEHVYGARALVPAVAGGLVLGTGIALLGAVRRWHAVTVVAALVAAYLVCGGALAAPSTTAGGVLPTVRTVTALAPAVVTSWKQVLTLQPPLGTGGTLLAAPYLLALVASALATALTLRTARPALGALAALVPGACLVLAAVLGTRQTTAPVATGLGLAVVLACWAAWRAGTLQGRRVVALLALGGVAVAGGVLGAPLVVGSTPRYVLRDELVPPFDPRAYPSPLSSFRKLVKQDDTVVLTATGLPAGARIRLATLDEFDGVVWNVAGDGSAGGTGEFRRVGEQIETAVTGVPARVDIVIGDLPGVWLPTVGQPTSVRFADPSVAGDLRYNDASGGTVLTRGLTKGLRYTLDVAVPPVPDDTAIGGAGAASVPVGRITGVPDAVVSTATDVARNAGTPVQIARSLQKALAEGGFFSDGLVDKGDYPSLSGHGADRLTALLGSGLMVGDSEQYASAMALMARQMGLPARVVLGFVPTDAQRAEPTVPVTAGDVDAWVEIAFSGVGWVPFDPTPPRTQTPQEDTKSTPTDPQPQVVQPPPEPPEPVAPPEDDTEQPQAEDPAALSAARPVWQRVVVAAGAVGVPLVVLAAPFALVIALKARRRRVRRRRHDVAARVAGGWEEIVDVARDLRSPPPALATRREGAVAIAGALGTTVGRLADDADEAVFGGRRLQDADAVRYWQQVDDAVERLRGSVPWRRRLRSRVALASLRASRRARRAPRPTLGRPLGDTATHGRRASTGRASTGRSSRAGGAR